MVKSKKRAKELAERLTGKAVSASLKWEGSESWTIDKFTKHWRETMDHYRIDVPTKDLKLKVIKWMSENGFSKEDINIYKKSKDWRTCSTVGATAANILNGMPAVREDFNNGKNSNEYLVNSVKAIISDSKNDVDSEEAPATTEKNQPSIQDRIRETSLRMTDDIEDAIEIFQNTPDSFDPKAFKVLNLLKAKEAKAAHARVIRDFYSKDLNELEEAFEGNDEQLVEGYSHLSKTQFKNIITFYKEVIDSCSMLMQESKVNRAPRAKKMQPKEKIVGKMKYLKQHEPLKLVSINPTDIIGAKELWVYNIKSRKLGRYVTDEFDELTVKGTTIVNYSESLSIQKTLRKPEEKLSEFRSAGKVQLRKFLEDINTTDTKLNGRINEDTVLLKVL